MAAKNKLQPLQGMIFTFSLIILMTVSFFIAAGRWDMLTGWLFLAVQVVLNVIVTVFMYKLTPELLYLRRKAQPDTKIWDIIILNLLSLAQLGIAIVAGLDVGRYQWSAPSMGMFFSGLFLITVGTVIFYGAFIVNRFAEVSVRIQKERNHTVISHGPYAVVRHPSYVGAILSLFGYPLLFGSVYAFIPTLIPLVLLIIRTYLEDRTLKEELDGYLAYSEQTRARLVPYVW